MFLHLFFELLGAMCSMLLTFVLVKSQMLSFERVENARSTQYYLALLAGVVVGAYLFGTANLWISGHHGLGRSIIGAIFGGTLTIEIYKWVHGYEGSTGAIFVPALTISIAIGRIGCFAAGLPDETYGVFTDLPIGYDFGDGPRHAVQLYESASMFVLLGVWLGMLQRAPGHFIENAFYYFIIGYASQRFIWEFLKPYDDIALGLNLFQYMAIIMIGYGLWKLKNVTK